MKLLIVTYSYSPDLTPRAFRWSAVAAQLARRGHQVHVLCSGVSKEGISVEPDNVVQVFRVKDWLLNASARVAPDAGNIKKWKAELTILTPRQWIVKERQKTGCSYHSQNEDERSLQ